MKEQSQYHTSGLEGPNLKVGLLSKTPTQLNLSSDPSGPKTVVSEDCHLAIALYSKNLESV